MILRSPNRVCHKKELKNIFTTNSVGFVYRNKGIVTSVWWIHEQLPINLEIRSEEDPGEHGPGGSLVRIQDSLLSYSISQEEDDHDQKEIQHVYSLRKKRKGRLVLLRKLKQGLSKGPCS